MPPINSPTRIPLAGLHSQSGNKSCKLLSAVRVRQTDQNQQASAVWQAQEVAECVRRERQLQIRGFFDFAAVAMALVGPNGNILRANPSLRKLLGFDLGEITQLAVSELLVPSYRSQITEAMSRLMTRQILSCEEEVQLRHKSGEVIWASLSCALITDEDDTVQGYAFHASDISERKAAEQALQRTSAFLRNILDSATYSVIATNEGGAIVEINQGARDLLGYYSAELLGESIGRVLYLNSVIVQHSRDRDSAESACASTLDSFSALVQCASQAGSQEWRYCRKDGSFVPVELSVSEMKDSEGKVFGYVMIGSDITERQRKNLELVEAKEKAERASVAKAEFLAKMSHEIRTPMNSVLGMTEILLETPLTADQRSYLELAQQSGKSLLHLINDILDFSKVEARRLVLEEVSFDLYETFVLCLRALTHSAALKGVDLILSMDESAPERVIGDPNRLGQVVVNLVSNAVKFTSEGEILVEVACADEPEGQMVTLHIAVRDSGPGVAISQRERIFQPFVQDDTGIARRFGGTGLGLSICLQLVELMGGKIWLESERGEGSTFNVSLSLKAVHPAVEQLESSSVKLELGVALLIDRNALSGAVTSSQLRKLGYSPVVSSSLDEAIDAVQLLRAKGRSLTLLVVDGAGWASEAGQILQRIQTLNGPVATICLSGVAKSEQLHGFEGVVYQLKPFTPKDLRAAIAEASTPNSERCRLSLIPRLPEKAPARRLSILVAEDNPTNQLVVSAMLARLGHDAEMVADGQAAVKRALHGTFDVILMDLQMPIMGGLEAVRRIREHESADLPRLPVVALTAQAMAGDREACLAAGMDAYLSKPIELVELGKVLDSYASTPPRLQNSALDRASTSILFAGRCVNFEILRERIGDRPEAMRKLSQLFELDSTRHLRELGAQIDEAGTPQRSGAAHTINGMLRNIGANQAALLATSLERTTEAGNWSQASLELGDLRCLVERICSELREQSLVAN